MWSGTPHSGSLRCLEMGAVMTRKYWYVWWGCLAAVVVVSQALNFLTDSEGSWFRWAIVFAQAAAWVAIPLLVAFQSPNPHRHLAFWWGTAVPIAFTLLIVLARFDEVGDLPLWIFAVYTMALVAVIFGGAIAVVVLWLMRKRRTTLAYSAVSGEPNPPAWMPIQNTHKRCPFCAEDVKIEAIKCKHCGSSLQPPPTASGLI